jgi:hypothetical protein
MNKARALILSGLSLAVSMDALAQSQGAPAGGVEDIYIVRSVRDSRSFPSDFCAETRTGFFAGAGAEDKFTLRSTATRDADGLMTSASVKPVGSLHACIAPAAVPMVLSFYAEGAVGAVSFKGRGECVQKRDVPEGGIASIRCFLDIYDVSKPYVGGLATSNAISSSKIVGDESSPPGYTQVGIFTLRLWNRR